jgi:hypothetical protein
VPQPTTLPRAEDYASIGKAVNSSLDYVKDEELFEWLKDNQFFNYIMLEDFISCSVDN